MNSPLILKTGDLVDIVAPGSGAPLELIQAGIKRLESWGLRVRLPEDLIEASSFFANSDKNRLKFLKKALMARDSKAVWCVRGGSGTHRILPELFKTKPARQKLILGFSDITSLHMGAVKHWKWGSVHGPVLTQLGRTEGMDKSVVETDFETLRAFLFGEIKQVKVGGLEKISQGRTPASIKGPLLGGNLTVFETLIGTKEMPKTKGSILFFEEVNERGYRVDRTLVHMRQAGVFDGVKAIVLGDFTGGDEPLASTAAPGRSSDGSSATKRMNRLHWAFENLSQDLKIPIYRGLPVGHAERNLPMWVGRPAEIRGKELICAPLS